MAYNKINPEHTRRRLIEVYPEAKFAKDIISASKKIKIHMRLYNQDGSYQVPSLNSSDSLNIFCFSDVMAIRDLLHEGLVERGFHDWSKIYCEWITEQGETTPTKTDMKRKVFLPGEKNPKYYMRAVKGQRRIEVQMQYMERYYKSQGGFSPWKYRRYLGDDGLISSSTFCILGIGETTAVTRIIMAILEGQRYNTEIEVCRNGKKRRIKVPVYELGAGRYGRKDGRPFRHIITSRSEIMSGHHVRKIKKENS